MKAFRQIRLVTLALCVLASFESWAPDAVAQNDAATETEDPVAEVEQPVQAPERVDVEPTAEDSAIAGRLERILRATEWFRVPEVRVDQGVVFLNGRTAAEKHKQWAGQLATSTQDVVAVVNRIQVDDPQWFDFAPAMAQMRGMARTAVQSAPTFAVALLIVGLSVLFARGVSRLAARVATRRVDNALLGGIVAKAVAVPVVLLGAYLALQVSGLTRLAATVLGGTGLIGVVVGIAFRDIAENFLASILISMQRPFKQGDYVTIADYTGFVQAVTTRGTQLMTLDGNHVQVPNATVYKSVIENVTANPKLRLGLTVGIDYQDSAAEAQTVILDAVKRHEAVLADPEPLVLVDSLATSTVNLQVWFWVNGNDFSAPKVRSAMLRQVKRVLQQNGFSLPDESREVIFPQGVPVRMLQAEAGGRRAADDDPTRPPAAAGSASIAACIESDEASTLAEGNLSSERKIVEKQAKESRPMGDETILEEAKRPAAARAGDQ